MWLDFGSFGETADTVFLVNASCCSTLIGSAERPVLWHQMQETVREDGIGLNKAWSWWWSRRRIKYLLTPYRRVLLSKLIGSKLVKKFPAFYRTRRFITIFTSARHLSLSWASSIQSIPPHPTSWRSNFILSSHLRLGLPSGLFPSCFPTKTLYTPLPSPIRATCHAHLIFLDFITRILSGELENLNILGRSCSFEKHVVSFLEAVWWYYSCFAASVLNWHFFRPVFHHESVDWEKRVLIGRRAKFMLNSSSRSASRGWSVPRSVGLTTSHCK